MKKNYDELFATIARLEKRIAILEAENIQLRKENTELKEENKKLKERLNLDSNNSSKPPSTDQKRNKQKPKGGALKGHKGHFRKPSDHVDRIAISKISQCQYCGSRDLDERSFHSFDQVDIPEIKSLVTRINRYKYRCKECGRKQIAPFPKGYDKTAFGPNLIGFIALCSSVYRMSKRTTQGLLKSLLKVNISLGSIPAMEKKVSRSLDPSFKTLQKRVDQTKVA